MELGGAVSLGLSVVPGVGQVCGGCPGLCWRRAMVGLSQELGCVVYLLGGPWSRWGAQGGFAAPSSQLGLA